VQPDAIEAFVAAIHGEINAGSDATAADRTRAVRELDWRRKKLEGMYDAVADGLRTPGLLAKIEALEVEIAELEATLATPPPSPVRRRPNLTKVYCEKVEALDVAFGTPLIRDEAIGQVRELIDRVDVRHGEAGCIVDWRSTSAP
jgi:site-specific DNA recombinase